MKKAFSTIAALGLSFYGAAGFWSNIGNETIHPLHYASIIAAMILAPFAILLSAVLLTKETPKKSIGKAGFVSLIISALSFAGFKLWLFNSDRINVSGKTFALIAGLILALAAAAALYAVFLFIIAAVRKDRA